jgi:hypothetical protein
MKYVSLFGDPHALPGVKGVHPARHDPFANTDAGAHDRLGLIAGPERHGT